MIVADRPVKLVSLMFPVIVFAAIVPVTEAVAFVSDGCEALYVASPVLNVALDNVNVFAVGIEPALNEPSVQERVSVSF